MKNEIVIEIPMEDVVRIMKGEGVSEKFRTSLYERLTRQRLQSLSFEELRDEFERTFDHDLIVELFFWKAERGTKTTSESLIEMLTDLIMDSYDPDKLVFL